MGFRFNAWHQLRGPGRDPPRRLAPAAAAGLSAAARAADGRAAPAAPEGLISTDDLSAGRRRLLREHHQAGPSRLRTPHRGPDARRTTAATRRRQESGRAGDRILPASSRAGTLPWRWPSAGSRTPVRRPGRDLSEHRAGRQTSRAADGGRGPAATDALLPFVARLRGLAPDMPALRQEEARRRRARLRGDVVVVMSSPWRSVG